MSYHPSSASLTAPVSMIGPVSLIGLAGALLLASGAPALARPGGWGSTAWGGPSSASAPSADRDRSREGRVEVDRFVAEGDAARALGQGAIAVASQSGNDDFVGPGDRAVFEAAVVDRLVQAGYDTTHAQPDGGQVAELRIVRREIAPAERPRKPVSGQAVFETGTRGSAYGLAVNVDLTKPLPSLVSTRLEARIRDRVTGTVLWEGHAALSARTGDARWTDQAIAARLAEALFDGFPRPAASGALPG